MSDKVDLYKPIVAANATPPLVLRVVIPIVQSFSEGVPAANARPETYVPLSAIPKDLRERVITAIQALIAQG